jgi:outer membrane lipoprotein-sorting protein
MKLMIRRNLMGLVLGLAILVGHDRQVFAIDQTDLLGHWFASQTNLQTWTADAVQTRTIKTFNQPLISTGRVFVAVPDRFRWELGNPPQTIAIRQVDNLYLVYPRLKRAEKYSLDAAKAGPWKDALALLEASFPASRVQLESRFDILAVSQTNQVAQVTLQPKSAFAKKFMSEIQIGFRTGDFSPAFTELKFSDGSTMRNDFSNSRTNTPLDATLFEPDLPQGTTIVEPGK